jgi:replicative DNA helicase
MIKAAHGRLDLVVVDFIQNVHVRGAGTILDRMATASVEFQRLAGELNACLLIASQLSNEAVRERGAGIVSFRYAAELAHASDLVAELVPKTDGTVDLLVRKQRSGRVGQIPLRWTGEWSRFEVVAGEARLHSGRGRTGKDHAAGDGRD